VDAVTGEAKYSLSEDRLIRQQIDYQVIVSITSFCTSVLTLDLSLSRVKHTAPPLASVGRLVQWCRSVVKYGGQDQSGQAFRLMFTDNTKRCLCMT